MKTIFNIFDEGQIYKLIGSLLIITLIYSFVRILRKITFWWKSEFKDLADPSQRSFLNYAKFVNHILTHKFEVTMFLSHSFEHYKKKGYFCVNLIFTKWVILFNPNYIHELLNDSKNIERPLSEFLKKGLGNDSLFLRSGEQWKERKQLLSPIFSKTNLNKFITVIENHSTQFLNELQSFNEKEWISVGPNCTFFVFKNVIDTLLGNTNNLNIKEIFKDVEKYKVLLLTDALENVVNVLFWCNKLFFLTKRGKRFRSLIRACHETIKKIILEQFEYKKLNESSNESSFITLDSVLFSAYKNKEITIDTFVDEIVAFFIAGIHVTSTALSLILYELGKHPLIQQKVQAELDAIFKSKEDNKIDMVDLGKMKYLECVIKETLRLYPLIPLTTRRSNKSHCFGDETFPKNTIFFISIYHLHLNSEIHAEPDVFNPDRFLPENSEHKHPCSFIPFSHGIRMCIGNRLSWLIMKICISTILRHVNIESFERDVQLTLMGFQLSPKDPIQIKIKSKQNLHENF